MDALVVYETQHGHTRRVAQTITAGLLEGNRVVLERCRPGLSADGYDLVVIGAPTHHGRLPTAASRRRRQVSGGPADGSEFGIREWLAGDLRPTPHATIALFDTLTSRLRLSRGSAAWEAARLLRRHCANPVLPPRSFLLSSPTGPLCRGELSQAALWANRLNAFGRAGSRGAGRPGEDRARAADD